MYSRRTCARRGNINIIFHIRCFVFPTLSEIVFPSILYVTHNSTKKKCYISLREKKNSCYCRKIWQKWSYILLLTCDLARVFWLPSKYYHLSLFIHGMKIIFSVQALSNDKGSSRLFSLCVKNSWMQIRRSRILGT